MPISAIVYLVIYFSGILVALSGRPVYGIYTYLFAFYAFAPGRWWGAALPSLRWSLIAALVTLFAIYIADTKKKPTLALGTKKDAWLSHTEVKLFGCFVIWVWIQNFWAISPTHMAGTILVTKFFLLIFLIQKTVTDEKKIIQFIFINLMGVAYLGWLGWLRPGSGRFENIGSPGINDGNMLATHLVAVLIPASLFLLFPLGKKKYLLIPFIALTLNGLFLTESRGALLGFLVGGSLLLFIKPKKVVKQFYFFLILGVIFTIGHIGAGMLKRVDKVTDASSVGHIDKSAYSRIIIAEAQLKMFALQPFIGYGNKGTQALSNQFIPREYLTKISGSDQARGRASHNLYLAILVNQGLIGALFFFPLLYISCRRIIKLRDHIRNKGSIELSLMYVGVGAGFISILVSSLFINSFRIEIYVWYIALIGTMYRLILSSEENANVTKPIYESSHFPAVNSTS